MITVQRYRAMILAVYVLTALSLTLDYFFPDALVEQFNLVLETQGGSTSELEWLVFMGALIFLVAFIVGSTYGLLRFRPWAPGFSVVGTLLVHTFLLPVAGPIASSAVSWALDSISSYLWGAILILAYTPPLREHFQRRAPGSGSVINFVFGA